MMRSMFSGVTGLRNHQLRMDVIGNNIANVNTIGFKGARVTFQEALSQTLSSASKAEGFRGGVNPRQIGLGVTLGSIDVIQRQGAIEDTGFVTDLAIEGSGFFMLSSGDQMLFTRAGAFDFDGNGNFVSKTNGLKVIGYRADRMGKIEVSPERLGPLSISVNERIDPIATTKMTFGGNLNANPDQGGKKTTIVGPAIPEGTFPIDTTLWPGDLDFKVIVDGRESIVSLPQPVFPQTTYTQAQVLGRLNAALEASPARFTIADNRLTLTHTENGHDRTLEILDLPPALNVLFPNVTGTQVNGTQALTFPLTIPPAGMRFSVTVGNTERTVSLPPTSAANPAYANPTDLLTALNNQLSAVPPLAAAFTAPALPSPPNPAGSVSLVLTGSGGPPAATVEIRNAPALLFGDIQEGMTRGTFDPVRFSTNVYDSLGGLHTVFATMEKVGDNLWEWKAYFPEIPEQDPVWNGPHPFNVGGGHITFNENGRMSYVDQTSVRIVASELYPRLPHNLEVDLDFNGLTQYTERTTSSIRHQNGYSSGSLDTINVTADGIILGVFSNGLSRNFGQVAMARFENPEGLEKVGGTNFLPSANSGGMVINVAGREGLGMVVPSSLEMSNVDLSLEFTNMIITQRGFQANSRIISSSDEMLQELVNLKR